MLQQIKFIVSKIIVTERQIKASKHQLVKRVPVPAKR